MTFPVVVKHRRAEARIYGRSKSYRYYRLAYHAGGKRVVRSFATYSEAKSEAKAKVRELAAGSQAAALSRGEASAALGIREALAGYRRDTGRTITALEAVTGYLDAARKLAGRSLGDTVDAYLATLASVKRKDIAEAVEQFIASRQGKTEAKDGRRPQLSRGYHYNVSLWLREFASTFPATAVCDLTRQHLSTYMAGHGKLSPKTRNERRNVVRMLLKWCVRQDYLAPHHRLLEADGMTHETADPEEIECYAVTELRALLENADADLLPVIALAALAGVRVQEAVRLTWEDVFRVPGHVEVSVAKSKTRSRRLPTICPALGQWLAPYRERSGPLWAKSVDMFHENFGALRDSLKIPARRNGLRHGFVSAHLALYQNENVTAAEAGNSPGVIHKNYKGMLTKAEGQRWFNVAPATAENVIPLPALARKDAP
jgi:integrase